MRRVRAALVAALLLLGTAGCATIPQTGPVQTAAPTAAADDPNVVLIPVEPRSGEAPDDIVQGFVLAAVGAGDFTVARKYLTSSASQKWNPAARVLVHQKGWDVTNTGTGRVRLTVPVSAEVGPTGEYQERPHTTTLDFRLVQVGGQWRISDAPDGILLAQNVFTGFAKPVALQFFDPTFRRLVPDVRWFPAGEGAAQRATDTVQALLAGPAAPLQSPVTASAFPVGTLLDGRVSVVDGTTVVPLRVPGDTPSRTTTDRIQQQLAASLQKATSTVRIEIGGRSAPPAPQLTSQPTIGQDPVVLAGGRFGVLSGGQVTEDAVLGRGVEALKPVAVTVSSRQRLAAVLTGSGQVALVTATGRRIVDAGPDPAAPTLDQQGWLYAVSTGDPAGLVAVRATGAVVDLGGRLGGSTATAVTSIEVSPDGTRMLVVAETGSGPKAYVAGIERKADGTPTGLTAASFPVDVDAESALDGTWSEMTTAAVLTGGTDTQSVIQQTVGGLSSRLGGPTGAVTISGLSGGGVLALLDSGALYQHAGNLWEVRPSGSQQVQVLAVQR